MVAGREVVPDTKNLKFSTHDEFNLAALKLSNKASTTSVLVMEDITKRQAERHGAGGRREWT